MLKLNISPLAKRDLEDIRDYITDELENPIAAKNVLQRITKRLRELPQSPRIGAPLASRVDIETDYRYLVCGNYTAFYRLDDKTVFVQRVLYGRRDFMKILFGETSGAETE